MTIKLLIAVLATCTAVSAQASTSINLGNYTVGGIYALDALNGTAGGISGLEASAVAYARDRGTLFFVGDEGTGVVEISLTGQTLGNNLFDWSGTGSTKHDTEGLTYLGGGVLVVGEERLQDAYRFSYTAGSTVALASSFVSMSNVAVGNNGMEGISYDPRDGSFVTIKQQSPENVLAGTLTFGPATGAPPSTSGDGFTPPGGGVSTVTTLFNPASMGLSTLSDVQTLSPVDALAGTAAADNLLVLSLGSRKLVEVDRSGNVLSSFDLSSLLNTGSGDFNAIEGLTVDEHGTIYLVAEQLQGAGAPLNAQSQLIVLTAPVPEPETYALMLSGLGLIGYMARRRRRV
ncbi:SdiA-regulated domain-containing protein [Thiobacillus sp.]|uniref:SdiA-regulated domain-containing protein n=1 Tax=Thiobacillus sp. TaxID=924 RepID=UPI0011D82945|nr:SdiA-regulated domain-containing protein [Thiobacillus sp.]TXH73165.1 MAG: PEP-CTERM sorting domain-containing protein [Thiobacillus sp.]